MTNKEKIFRMELQDYKQNDPNQQFYQKKVLLEKEEYLKFAFSQINCQAGHVMVSQEELDYYLEKNFILHRYTNDYTNQTAHFREELFRHYQLLLTRNFEDISLSLLTNRALKPYLVAEYVRSLDQTQDPVKDLITKRPDKICEVSYLLSDYEAYLKDGVSRDKTTITEETINQPFQKIKKIFD